LDSTNGSLLCVQQIDEDEVNIQLASLRLEGTMLIWWEGKLQEGIQKSGKILSSWSEFKAALRKQFYPLAYRQKEIMEWKYLRQGKGQSVQDFTEEFRKKALALNISLHSTETLLKYIGALHSYIRHTLLLLNPTDFDEVCVQVVHLESRGKDTKDGSSKEFSQQKGSKNKGKEKQVATVKKEEANLTCTHCKKSGHDEDHCWKLHPELRPKKYGGKGKKKVVVTVQQDLGSESGDETQITVVGVVNASKNVSMMSAKASEGYDNEIVKLSPSHEVFQNSPKFPHEGPLHAGDRDFVRERRNVVNSLSVASICSLLLLICCAWPVVENMNADRCGS
jgi:hypothetical protein